MTHHSGRRYGLLMPHFGEHAGREKLLGGARQVEALGFDSVWFRDRLVFRPFAFESQNRGFVDTFIVMSAVAAVTERITVGSASLTPHRHPVYAAHLMNSLDVMSGRERFIAGWGVGAWDHEFEAIGQGDVDRRSLIEEQLVIFAKLLTGEPVTHEGEHYRFADVEVNPVDPARPVPLWYCGASMAAVRRAADYCSGWLPARMPRRDLRRRIQRLDELLETRDRPRPTLGIMPFVSPAKSMEEAVDKVPLDKILEETSRFDTPESGGFHELADLDGALIAGTPDDVVEEVERFHEMGLDHIVFDLRHRFDDWDECLGILAESVLPELRRGGR